MSGLCLGFWGSGESLYAAVLGSRVADREINVADMASIAVDAASNAADMASNAADTASIAVNAASNAADTVNNTADTTNAPQPGTKMCRACGACAVSYVRVSRLPIS